MLFHTDNPNGPKQALFHEVLRMRVHNILGAMMLVVMLVGLAAWPVPAADKAEVARIAKLVEQLGSDTFSDRQKASEALDTIGAPALDALRKAAQSTDAEVRKRAQELVDKIEKRTENARALDPKMVHLVYKDTPLADAVADLAKKSGYPIQLHDPDGKLKGKTITLDTGKVTFWNALEQFCAKTGVIDGAIGIAAPPVGVGALPGGGAVVPPALPPPPAVGPAVVVPIAPPKPPAKAEKKEEDAKEKKGDGKKTDTKKADDTKGEAKKEEAKPAGGKAARIGIVLMPRVAGGAPAVVVPLNPVVGAPAGMGVPGMPSPYGPITLSPGKAESQAVDTASAVRVRAADKKHYRLSDEEIALVLHASPEPRLNWQGMSSVVIDRAIDDNDQKLTQSTAPANGGVGVPGAGGIGAVMMPGAPWGNVRLTGHGQTYSLTVRLKKGDKEAKSLKELTGTISGQCRGDAESLLVIDDIMKAAGKSVTRKPSGELKILTVDKQEDGTIQIHFELEFPANTVAESAIPLAGAPAKPLPPAPGVPPPVPGGGVIAPPPVMAPQHFAFNGLTLRDAKGNILNARIEFHWKRAGGFVIGNRRMEYIATYKPTGKDAPQPAKLVFTGRRDMSVSIPFTLKNVELK